MRHQYLIFGVLVVLVACFPRLGLADPADEGWGDLGASHSDALVEPIPESIMNEEAVAAQSEPARPVAEAVAEESRTFGEISTIQNTYGVLTEERKPVQFYLSPFGGMQSLLGNSSVDVSPKYAVGVEGGLLLSSHFLLGVSFTYAEMGLSGIKGISFYNPSNVFGLKTNHVDLDAKFFFLGRESRVRPFFGGGFGWTQSYLNYASANGALSASQNNSSDYILNQLDGFGELGVEVAITRAIAVSAGMRVNGALSSSSSSSNGTDTSSLDASKVAVGDSLSRSATYTIGAGLGVYF